MRDIVDHMFQNFFASMIWKEFGESHLMGGFKLVCSMSISCSIVNSICGMLRL
jgi:hypothetical protein